MTQPAKYVPAYMWHPLHATFAWPTGFAYTIRNHFLHEGGQRPTHEFFAGRDPGSAFQISDDAFRYLDRRYRGKEDALSATMTRAPEPWPWPQDDLRELLRICVREMDSALGILVGTTAASLRLHTELILE